MDLIRPILVRSWGICSLLLTMIAIGCGWAYSFRLDKSRWSSQLHVNQGVHVPVPHWVQLSNDTVHHHARSLDLSSFMPILLPRAIMCTSSGLARILSDTQVFQISLHKHNWLCTQSETFPINVVLIVQTQTWRYASRLTV